MFSCFFRWPFVLTVTVVVFGHVTLPVQGSLLNKSLDFSLRTALTTSNSYNLFFPLLESYFKSANFSERLCFEHIKDVATGILTRQEWALSMIDAFGKPVSNIIGGNFGWTGSYKECSNIQRGSFSGKYCWLKIYIFNYQNSSNLYPYTRLGICVPDSCNDSDLQLVFQFYTKDVKWVKHAGLTVSADCIFSPLDNLHKDVIALTAIAVCCVLFLLAAFGTILDLHSKIDKNCSEKPAQSNEFGKKKYKKKWALFSNVLKYFSIHSNVKKLFHLTISASAFSELNGLKVIAAMIMVYFHTFVGSFAVLNNPSEAGFEFGSWLSQLTIQIYTVDIFFLVTGFLTLNGILINISKIEENNYSIFKFIAFFILPRYLKLLIAPGIIIFVSRMGLQPYLSSGPFWKITDEICRDSWWRNVLFISNFWTMSEQCFSAWWFLSASIQLHVISLVIVIPLIKKRYFACVFNGCTILICSWCWLTYQSYVTTLPLRYPKELREVPLYHHSKNVFFNVYDKPHYHFGSYFIGMALSWIIFKRKDAIVLTKKQLYLGWSLSSALFFVAMFGIYLEPNDVFKSLHTGFGVTMYSLSFAWLIIICNVKDGGLVSSVLRWKYGLPLSKLSLTVYLIHPTVVDTFYLSEVEKIHYSFSLFLAIFLRNCVVSYAIAAVATLMIEMPITALIDLNIKHLFATKSRRVNQI